MKVLINRSALSRTVAVVVIVVVIVTAVAVAVILSVRPSQHVTSTSSPPTLTGSVSVTQSFTSTVSRTT